MPPFRIITIGASVGGVESLCKLVEALPADLDAAVFVVLHIPQNHVSNLPGFRAEKGPLHFIRKMGTR